MTASRTASASRASARRAGLAGVVSPSVLPSRSATSTAVSSGTTCRSSTPAYRAIASRTARSGRGPTTLARTRFTTTTRAAATAAPESPSSSSARTRRCSPTGSPPPTTTTTSAAPSALSVASWRCGARVS
ncbi:Uncharacterised protein [Mycobacteroides abscessus]|nr:Uncharacterised protein [Mycobacteroides abscessus]